MDLPKVAGTAPIKVEMEEGKKYAWCSCGLSSNQPLCDGNHKGTGFAPTVITAEASKAAFFCTCKKTNNGCFCDGAHKNL